MIVCHTSTTGMQQASIFKMFPKNIQSKRPSAILQIPLRPSPFSSLPQIADNFYWRLEQRRLQRNFPNIREEADTTNLFKQKRDDLLSKISVIRVYIIATPQDENTLLGYLSDLEKDVKYRIFILHGPYLQI